MPTPTKYQAGERVFVELKEIETFTPVAKHLPGDRISVITGGYGDTNVELGQKFTEAEADDMLHVRVETVEEKILNAIVHVPLTQGMVDGLVLFIYNIGGHAFLTSTLRKKLNDGDYAGAAAEFPRWNEADGQILPGLIKRRALERSWFIESPFPAVEEQAA